MKATPVLFGIIFSAALGIAQAESAVVDHDGDINLDANVNTNDIFWGLQALFGYRTLNPEQEAHGDVAPLVSGIPAPDGIFDLGDVLVIQRKVLELTDFSFCGDGIVQTVEQCDDGNRVNDDSCSNTCQFTQVIVPQVPIELFDGGPLTGLYPWFSGSGFSDPGGVFTVENSLLHVSGDGWGTLTTSDRYRDYVMVLEFKWGTQTWAPRQGLAKDAGVLIHSNGTEGGWNGLLMPGIQVQVLDGSLGDLILNPGDEVPLTMNVFTNQVVCSLPSHWNCAGGYRWDENGTEVTFTDNTIYAHWSGWDGTWTDVAGFRGQTVVESPNGDWNQLVVVASGSMIEVYLNGVKVNSAFDVSPDEGQLQLEVEFAEYFVRRWELHPLGYAVNPIITTAALPGGSINTAYSEFVKAGGIFAPVMWTKTGGTLPDGLSLNPNTGELSGTPTAEGLYNFTIQVTDTAGGTTSQDFTIHIGNGDLITAGLVLHLEATQGIIESGGIVTEWIDLSGSANNLFASGDPQLVAGLTPTGQPAISFDGAGDKLQRIHATNPLTGLPIGNANRTMFLVTRYNAAGSSGGATYGTGAQNQAFGPMVRHTTDQLALMGWGNDNDLVSSTLGTGAGWLIQSAALDNGTAAIYKDGAQIAQWSHTYNTVLSRFVLGAEIADFGYLTMDVAAVLVYNRALDADERATVEAYLRNKYLGTAG